MTPLQALKQASKEFAKRDCSYCLIGGHAASLYRRNIRVTKDVDFTLVTEPIESAQELAEEVIAALHLKPVVGFIAGHRRQNRQSEISLITSIPQAGELTGIIDILLPKLPWISQAVQRAQFNQIDLGFARVPVITPEDLVLAKCYALQGAPDRFQDLDDLKEILSGSVELEYDYLLVNLDQLGLSIPKVLKSSVPKALKRVCK